MTDEERVELARVLRDIAEQIVGRWMVSYTYRDASEVLHFVAELLDPGGYERLMAYAIEEDGAKRSALDAGAAGAVADIECGDHRKAYPYPPLEHDAYRTDWLRGYRLTREEDADDCDDTDDS